MEKGKVRAKKRKPSVTFKCEFDLNNREVKEFFNKKIKTKGLQDITLDEIFNECPVKPTLKAFQLNKKEPTEKIFSIIPKWQTSYDIENDLICPTLERYRIYNMLGMDKETIHSLLLDIKCVLKKTYSKKIPFFDILEIASGFKIIDGRRSYQDVISNLKSKLGKEPYQADEKNIKKQILILEKLQSKKQNLKRFISCSQMVGNQCLKLFECFRKKIPLREDLTDKVIFTIIADLLNSFYQVNSFDHKIIKEFRRNAINKSQQKTKIK